MRYLYLSAMMVFFLLLYLFYKSYFIALMMLAFMVLFHEWGHFLAARACGVRVDIFSIGFGKQEWCLCSFKWGQTEYRIAPILLGGYVKMRGQDDLNPTHKDNAQDSYTMQPPYKRIIILFAGPFANLLLGFFALSAIALIGKEELAPIIAAPQENTPAYAAHLQAADEIVAVNGIKVQTWEQMSALIQEHETGPITLNILREGKTITSIITPELKTLPNIFGEPVSRLVIGIRPLPFTAIHQPQENTLAQKIGLQKNDIITAINGNKVWNFEQINQGLNHIEHITFLRNAEEKNIYLPEAMSFANALDFGLLPAADSVRVIDYGLWGSLLKGLEESIKMSSLMLVSLEKIFVGVVPVSELGGVVMIMQVTSEAAKTGIIALLSIAALISLNLGIINLLPIPVLDGGHIVFNIYEMLFKRSLNPEILYRFTLVGVMLVVGLMLLGLYNDISRIIQ